MADTKISDLTAVTTPASTDEFAVAQSGSSLKMTRAQVHKLEAGEVLDLADGAVGAPAIFMGTDAGFYYAGGRWRFTKNGQVAFEYNESYIRDGVNTNGPYMAWSNASSTSPTFCPSKADLLSGLGWNSTGNPCLVANDIEAIRAENPSTLAAGETSLWLYDDDNATLEQVTVGAADSGGAGFKVLRIPN